MGAISAPLVPMTRIGGMRRVIAGPMLQAGANFLNHDGEEIDW
jgi:hypothetical protein